MPMRTTGIKCFRCGKREGIDCPGRTPDESTLCQVCFRFRMFKWRLDEFVYGIKYRLGRLAKKMRQDGNNELNDAYACVSFVAGIFVIAVGIGMISFPLLMVIIGSSISFWSYCNLADNKNDNQESDTLR